MSERHLSSRLFDRLAESENYIVVTEFDGSDHAESLGPIVHESWLGLFATKQAAEHRAARLAERFGRVRIARLVFDDIPAQEGEDQ